MAASAGKERSPSIRKREHVNPEKKLLQFRLAIFILPIERCLCLCGWLDDTNKAKMENLYICKEEYKFVTGIIR